MELVIEIAGWIAAGVLLGAYGLLSKGRMSGRGRSYQSLNVVGSLLVGLNSLAHEAWPSVTVNVVWLAIGVATLAASRRSAADAATDTGSGQLTAPDGAAFAASPSPVGVSQEAAPAAGPDPSARGDSGGPRSDDATTFAPVDSMATVESPTRTDMPLAVVGSPEGATAGRTVQPTLV